MHIFLTHKQNATYTERKILFKSQWEKQGKQKVTESSHMASASVNSLGNDVTCQGVSRMKLSPWSIWYQLNCFTAVIPCLSVCLSVAPDPWETACSAACSNDVTVSHLSPTLNHAAIQRFLFLEPQAAMTLAFLYYVGFSPFKTWDEPHVSCVVALNNSAFCPQKVYMCYV